MSDSSVIPWLVACQAPLSSCPRQESWRGLPFLSPGDLPDTGIKPISPALDLLLLSHQRSPIIHTRVQELFQINTDLFSQLGFPGGSVGKKTANVGDVGSVPGSGRSPGGGNDNPLRYSCLKNPMDKRSLVGFNPRDHKRVRHNLAIKQPFFQIKIKVHQNIIFFFCRLLLFPDKKFYAVFTLSPVLVIIPFLEVMSSIEKMILPFGICLPAKFQNVTTEKAAFCLFYQQHIRFKNLKPKKS